MCVENRFRSQIAEAYFNRYAPEGWRAKSAGIRPAKEVHPCAMKLMLEEGIDISNNNPKPITKELQDEAEMVIVVCSGALCPMIKNKRIEEWKIPDPAEMPIEEARKIRDEIKIRVLNLVKNLSNRP